MQLFKKLLFFCVICGTALAQQKLESYTQSIPGSDVKYDLVAIQGGEFLMGSPANEKGR